MYTERYSIPFLAGVLISALERRRLGLGPWAETSRGELRAIFDSELAAMKSHFFELFDDRDYWDKVERTLSDVCFLRYCAVAEKQTQLEQRDYGLWRGGDLIARWRSDRARDVWCDRASGWGLDGQVAIHPHSADLGSVCLRDDDCGALSAGRPGLVLQAEIPQTAGGHCRGHAGRGAADAPLPTLA